MLGTVSELSQCQAQYWSYQNVGPSVRTVSCLMKFPGLKKDLIYLE